MLTYLKTESGHTLDFEFGQAEIVGSGSGGRKFLRLQRAGAWGESLFIKNIGTGIKAKQLAKLEFTNSQRLRECGISSPKAWGICGFINPENKCEEHFLLLEDLGSECKIGPNTIEQDPQLLAKIGGLIAQLHQTGIVHHDLHIWNILRKDDELFITDLRTMKFKSELNKAEKLADFAHLLSKIPDINQESIELLIDGYGGDFSVEELVEAGWTRFRQHHHNLDRRQRRMVKGVHPAVWTIEPINSTLINKGEALKNKPGSPSTIHKVALLNGTSAILKHYRPTKRFDLRNFFGRSKAITSYLAIESIKRRGLRAAQALAAWSEPSQGAFMLLEDLTHLPRLQDALKSKNRPAQRILLGELATFCKRMHRSGIYFRDLKPSNILVDQKAKPGQRFVLIDHDRNRFTKHPLKAQQIAKDLAALQVGLRTIVDWRDLLFGLRRYDRNLLSVVEDAIADRNQHRGHKVAARLSEPR